MLIFYHLWLSNLFRLMKVVFILMWMGTLTLWASDAHSQNATIHINDYQNLTIEKFIHAVESQTNYLFVYSKNDINTSASISLPAEAISVKHALDNIAGNVHISYLYDNDYIVLTKKDMVFSETTSGYIQANTVSGTISDENGEPIPGVNITIKGTITGTVTDVNGQYKINVPNNEAVLVFSFIGYTSQEIVVGTQRSIDINLAEETKHIEEVVVVGYGVQKKVNLTGSVSSVKFDEELENRPITNASQALSGKVPGVWVSQNSGKPGADGAQLRVRGWGTLNNSDPLVIIDGVEGGFNQINPNDIESITVLKDAASSAIYGSKAANGVILVTTKMGNRNEKTEINFSSYFGVQSIGRHYNLVNNSAEAMRMYNTARTNIGQSEIFPDYLISAFENGTDPYKHPNTDWMDVFYKTPVMYEGNLSVKGGTQKSASYLSLNYMSQDGLVPNSQSYRYGIRANVEYDVKDWIKVGGRFNYIRRIADEPFDLDRTFEILRGAAPFIAPYTRDGRFGSVEAIDNQGALLYDCRNPFIDTNNGQRRLTSDFVTVNAFVDIKLAKDLLLKTTWSSTGVWGLIDRYNEPLFGYTDSGIETMTKNYNREGIEMIRNFETISMNNNFYATLNYNKTFNVIHDFSVIAGAQTEAFSNKTLRARRTTPPKTGLTQVDAGTTGIQGEGNLVGLRMFSFFGRINYSLLNKYLFEANFRADASSRFKEGNRWGYFPGISAGWRVSEEEFIKSLGVFSNFKLRGSWGELGNQSISGYWPYLTVIEQSNALSYNYNGTFAPGAAVTSLVDENITWETTSTLDFGVDLGFFQNRLNIEADYFYKKTTDIIVQLPMSKLLGNMTAPFENIGEMLNKGVEFSVNYGNNKTGKDKFSYNVGVNFTYINNKVTKFQGGKAPDQLYLIREDYSYQTLYGYNAVGVYQTDAEASEHMHANGFKPQAGYLKFEDVNGDGKLGFEDKKGIGNTIPKITYGISANFAYQNFDLSMLFQGISGAYLYTQSQYTRIELELQTLTEQWRNAWTPENTNTNIPSLKMNSSWDNENSSFWMHKSDFLKLRNIQLGYTVPAQIASRLKLEKLYLFANAQNVFTVLWHKGYEGFDPERASNINGDAVYPVARIVSFGINLTF